MAEKLWKPFPLFLYGGEDGEDHIVANERQIDVLEQMVTAKEQELDSAKERGDKKSELKTLELAVGALRANFERTKGRAEALRPKCKKKDYQLAKPTFGVYIKAQEQSKDFINGEPSIDRSRLMLNLLSGYVKIDGDVLEQDEVEDLDPQVALVLFSEMESRLFPNPDRLPLS